MHPTPATAARLADAPLSIADILTLQLPDFIATEDRGLQQTQPDKASPVGRPVKRAPPAAR